ncbi:NACHT domain-containing protein [Streptomyces ziwulingensis]|uniref:NACHT domain-containing protein n=1 Tax=Streptomyces ziwulingensis TaxID=1045501 RepID=A0ABP9CU26_9ACTN
MSAEAAALRLGSSVARAAAQIWLGGRRREQERHLPMEELIRVRVGGVRLQRSVARQFGQIADAVFDRLEPFLAREFRHLDEESRRVVVDAVCGTLERADLSDDALLVADANAAELIRRITRAVPAPAGLGEAEEALYALLLAECVEYYVRVVRGLPVFEERATAELLVRTATLGAEIARILERLPDRSLLAPDGSDQDTAFRRRYLELVSRDLDEVELFRRTAARASSPRVRLSVAYVSLRASGDDGRRREGRALPRSRRPEMSDWESRDEGSGMRVEAALGGASRVLLRGEAGSGKTTLLRWLAVTAARGAFTGELADWNGLVPVFVKLREYSGRRPPPPGALLDGVAGQITGIMPRGWVERQLDSGRVLLLIDGVDELLDKERRAVRDWLRRLLGEYGSVRVVVTSRPAAAGADWLRREDFTALHLDRMTPSDLAAFVRQWHQAVREVGAELPCPVDELPRYEQSLLTSLKDRPHLRSLAGTPLLAAMLCAMHLNRGRRLPHSRLELYRDALHTLVHERDADRNVPSALESPLGLGDKLVLLRDLAWRLSDNNRSDIDLERAAGYVSAKLRAMRHLDPLDGARVLAQLRDRSGVLRSPAEGRLDFVHRTFQEYLAAEEAAQEDRMGNLVERAHLDLWRETVMMAAGHAHARQREELLGGILDRADREPRHARALRLLAASCQETLPEVPDALAARLDAAVTALLPARRPTDPPALAAVGPSLLRRLPRSLAGLTEKAAVQTVRTVALIGGAEALGVLAGYVGEGRPKVIEELIEAWAYFDSDSYADEVLARLTLRGRWITVTHSGQWSALRRLKHADWLYARAPLPRDPTELPPLTRLLAFEYGAGLDLGTLRAHPGLHTLALLGFGPMTGAEAVADLTALRSLYLNVPSASWLEGLRLGPDLDSLSLWFLPPATDLSVLAGHPGLRTLELMARTPCSLEGMRQLSALPGLESLTLHSVDATAWLDSPDPLPPSLKRLRLLNCVLPTSLELPGVQVTAR